MSFDWTTFAVQAVNFAILVWLAQRFLYRPVLRAVDARRDALEAQRTQVHALEVQARERLTQLEADRRRLEDERAGVVKETAAQAEQTAAARRAQAERQAAAMLEAARAQLAAERDTALDMARTLALDLGVDIARRLLDEIPAKLRAQAWLARIEQHLAALTAAERAVLDGAGPVRVITAAPLPPAVQAQWRARLGAALNGAGQAIAFDADPALLAGAELHFPHAVLRWSWRSALDALRAQAAGDDGPA
mgnify:CR=1 FL=1